MGSHRVVLTGDSFLTHYSYYANWTFYLIYFIHSEHQKDGSFFLMAEMYFITFRGTLNLLTSLLVIASHI